MQINYRKIVYFSQAIIPSDTANSIHIVKFVNAIYKMKIDISLYGRYSESSIDKESISEFYGTNQIIDLRLTYTPFAKITRLLNMIRALHNIIVEKPEVVYTRSPRFAALSAHIGQSTVLELHRPHDYANVRRYLSHAANPLLVVITNTLRRKLISDLGCADENILVAADGADPMLENVTPAIPRIAHDSRLRIGFLGSLYPGKGMEVIPAIAERCPWADFHIVGGDSKAVSYWQARLRPQENMFFHGHVPHSQTPGFLKSFDVALLPNQNFVGVSGGGDVNISEWTSPLKAFEYMSAGLPILASDQLSLREIFEHGRNALLCTPDDVDSWVRTLEQLRSDCFRRRALGLEAHSDFVKSYTWDARARFLVAEMCKRRLLHD